MDKRKRKSNYYVQVRTLSCPKCEEKLSMDNSRLRWGFHFCEFCGHEFTYEKPGRGYVGKDNDIY